MKTTLSNEDVLDRIAEDQYHLFPGTTVIVCCITLDNGFPVIGHSACVDPARFDVALGRRMAQQNAVQKALDYLAFLLREKMHTLDDLGLPYDKADAFMSAVLHHDAPPMPEAGPHTLG